MAEKLLEPQRTQNVKEIIWRSFLLFLIIFIFLSALDLSSVNSVVNTFSGTSHAYAQPLPVPEGEHCAECGMTIDRDSKFASEVIDAKGGRLFFCDIGDMLYHFRKTKSVIRSVYVRDFTTGAWIDGRKARYVPNKKFVTPMSWGIAAFSSNAEAVKWGVPADFDAAFGLAK
jgi:copper chaperone NosL